MKWPLIVLTPTRRETEGAAEARLHQAVDRLEGLTKRLEAAIAEVQEGDLGSGERRR